MIEENDRPTCLVCGRQFRSVGRHVRLAHGISATDYRDRFGIRRTASLSSPATRERAAARIRSTIVAGKLDAHFAGNGERAVVAAASARQARDELRRAGIDPTPGAPPTPRAVIEAIVVEIEAGARVASAVKRSPIAYTGFHFGLARHPELRERVDAAKQSRKL